MATTVGQEDIEVSPGAKQPIEVWADQSQRQLPRGVGASQLEKQAGEHALSHAA